jgi:hypothetical protein
MSSRNASPAEPSDLIVVAESPSFPNAALVYKPGNIAEPDLKKLRDGSVHRSPATVLSTDSELLENQPVHPLLARSTMPW